MQTMYSSSAFLGWLSKRHRKYYRGQIKRVVVFRERLVDLQFWLRRNEINKESPEGFSSTCTTPGQKNAIHCEGKSLRHSVFAADRDKYIPFSSFKEAKKAAQKLERAINSTY